MKYIIKSIYLLMLILSSCTDGVRVATVRDNNWSYYDRMPASGRQNLIPNQRGVAHPMQRAPQGDQTPRGNFIVRPKYKQIASERKNEYYRPQQREKKKPALKFTAPDAFYSAESKSDETVFLEDVEFDKTIDKNGKKIYAGRKLFFKNKITDKFIPEDNKNLMTSIGVCRANLLEVKADLADDGVLNSSVKDSVCERTLGGKNFIKQDMVFRQRSFQDLEDWHGDDFKDAMVAFLSSCELFKSKEGVIKSNTFTVATYQEMRPICEIFKAYHALGFDKLAFERYFSPFLIHDRSKSPRDGLFTGYYLWELKASKFPTQKYRYPIFKKPTSAELIQYSRRDINQGALSGKGLEILWCDNLYDIYSLQVQGSGIAFLEDGTTVRLGFDGKNNFKFRSYSEKVKQEPDFFSARCSQHKDVIECMKNNEEVAFYATNYNESFVFLKALEGEDIFGSQGVPLTQSRSIAVDPKYHPYGLPYYIETSLPLLDTDSQWLDFNRLWISQDTGSAIKGISRADMYMGHGFKGEYIAKNSKFPGTMYILLPNFAINRLCSM